MIDSSFWDGLSSGVGESGVFWIVLFLCVIFSMEVLGS